jgi:hypothetical protein
MVYYAALVVYYAALTPLVQALSYVLGIVTATSGQSEKGHKARTTTHVFSCGHAHPVANSAITESQWQNVCIYVLVYGIVLVADGGGGVGQLGVCKGLHVSVHEIVCTYVFLLLCMNCVVCRTVGLAKCMAS